MAKKGEHLSEETKAKLRKPKSEETKRKIRLTHLGTHASEETKMKMSMARKGRAHSQETRRKLSECRMGEKHHNWNGNHYQTYHRRAKELFGKPCCEECGIHIEEYAIKYARKKHLEMHCVSKDFTILEQWNWICLCYPCHAREHRFQ